MKIYTVFYYLKMNKREYLRELERLPAYVIQLKPETIAKIKNASNA
jgi:hypothetical protein